MAARSEGLPRRESTCIRDRRPKSNVTMGGGEALGQNREDAHYVSAKSSAFLSASESMRALKSFTVLRKSVILRGSIASAGAPSVASSECTPPMRFRCPVPRGLSWIANRVKTLRYRACIARAVAVEHNAQSSGPQARGPQSHGRRCQHRRGRLRQSQVTKSVTIDGRYAYARQPQHVRGP